MTQTITITDRATPKAARDAQAFLASLSDADRALIAELLRDGRRCMVKDLAEERGFTRGAGGALKLATD